MRLFELFGYWDCLGAFFFTFKTFDAIVRPIFRRDVAVVEAGDAGIVANFRLVVMFQLHNFFEHVVFIMERKPDVADSAVGDCLLSPVYDSPIAELLTF